MDDKRIISLLRTSPAMGFKALLGRYKEPLYWHVRRIMGSHDDAADVLQETFMRVYLGFDSFRHDDMLRPWLYRIATNECMRALSRRAADTVSIDGEGGVYDIMADPLVDYSDLEAVKLHRAVLALPPRQRSVFALRYYDEMEYAEISRVVGISVPAAKMNYHLAKRKVCKSIAEMI